MNRTARWIALALASVALLWWLGAGANPGWTKTSVPRKTVDEVTGIEAIEYEQRFVPGLDFVGAALVVAAVLAGSTLLLTQKRKQPMQSVKSVILTLIAAGVLSSTARATQQTFDFKDPKGVNNVVFKLDAPLEAINGSANGITGTVRFDPEKPAALSGKIIVASSTLHVPNPMMKTHLHGDQWMNVTKFPEITFETKQLKNPHTTGELTSGEMIGTLTILGVSKEVTVPVKVTYLKDKLGQRIPNLKGDLLVIRSNFAIKRTDFGINPKAPEDKVSDTIDLSLSIAGAASK